MALPVLALTPCPDYTISVLQKPEVFRVDLTIFPYCGIITLAYCR